MSRIFKLLLAFVAAFGILLMVRSGGGREELKVDEQNVTYIAWDNGTFEVSGLALKCGGGGVGFSIGMNN